MSDRKLITRTAIAFRPLLNPSRYKAAHGGRGSGKSHFFAERIVIESIKRPGLRTVCIREYLKTLKESAKQLIEDKIQALDLASVGFNVLVDKIETPGGGFILFQGMQNHNAESIKSLEGMDIAWIEEAQTLSERSFSLLRPTIRQEGSEIWASWNPTRKADAVDRFFRQGDAPPNAIVVQANWRDNPWFPQVLQEERLFDKAKYPERYEHVWEGDYAGAFEGSYFAKELSEAKADNRIGSLAIDPILPCKAFFDIGVSDATSIWIAQFAGDQIRVLDYIESVGQPLAYYTSELRDRGWADVKCYLPHDGLNKNAVTGLRYEDHLRDAGFDVESVPNQGKGATKQRIEATRRLFPKVWFEDKKTGPGREALGFYHEKRDEDRNVGLGPEHDWSSHAADAFGLMAICYESPARGKKSPINYPKVGYA